MNKWALLTRMVCTGVYQYVPKNDMNHPETRIENLDIFILPNHVLKYPGGLPHPVEN